VNFWGKILCRGNFFERMQWFSTRDNLTPYETPEAIMVVTTQGRGCY
jgi:hypothetical protein